MKRHLSFIAALGMCFFASINAAYAQVRADTGGIAIGGSGPGSTIKLPGPPPALAAPRRPGSALFENREKGVSKARDEHALPQTPKPAPADTPSEKHQPPH